MCVRSHVFKYIIECLNVFGRYIKMELRRVTVFTLCVHLTVAFDIFTDFQSGWGGWYQEYGDNFDWTRIYGSTGSSGTGPTDGHSGYSYDNYVYTEASSPRSVGQSARLRSPLLSSERSQILQFYYHMYGAEMGTLNVYRKSTNGYDILWTKSGNQGNLWYQANVPFQRYGTSDNYIVFEGIIGTSFTSDIAIDDISITGNNELDYKTDVVCSGSNMTVYLDTSLNITGNVHFLDPTCTAAGYVYRSGTQWIYLNTRYDECKTSMTSTLTSTTYHNQIIASETGGMISRKGEFHIFVECEIDNRGRSSVRFKQPEINIEHFNKRENGNFTFTMDLYTSGDYSTPYQDWSYPVELIYGSKVYVGASVQTFTNDMVLFVDSCKATPHPDPDANPQYQIIENSCGVDSTVEFGGQTSNHTARVFFSFDTFGFIGDYSTVFVHCQLSICNGSDSHCHRNCRQRQRRDVSAPDKLSDTVPIFLGPVILKRSDEDSKVVLDIEESTSKGFSFALSSTLLFAVSLVVLGVGCAYWIKSRIHTRNAYSQLQNISEEM
ncbi:ZP domain-containing protein-like [Anneissia japonica]|uniref:ZP domain-containing protein-like n=1 Tax=Anneissia japonica TaxID=1529436 RepID=UPI001425AD4C|nr:ZP domain-containing protein-like [Anneissia japonica]